jgi:hypothetical protein
MTRKGVLCLHNLSSASFASVKPILNLVTSIIPTLRFYALYICSTRPPNQSASEYCSLNMKRNSGLQQASKLFEIDVSQSGHFKPGPGLSGLLKSQNSGRGSNYQNIIKIQVQVFTWLSNRGLEARYCKVSGNRSNQKLLKATLLLTFYFDCSKLNQESIFDFLSSSTTAFLARRLFISRQCHKRGCSLPYYGCEFGKCQMS